jgi:FtsP/CotA-like multicopper oxidase with cupredoxin domain
MQTDTLVFEPGSRYDLIIDFSDAALAGKRVIMENIGGDSPFGGDFGDDLGPDDFFPNRQTDRIMAFDVTQPLSAVPDNFNPANISSYNGNNNAVTNYRDVALFEGLDEYGRLQPLLGAYDAGEFKAIPWHAATTENPALNATEEWRIFNFTGDAHPIHLHLVNFEILGRNALSFDEGAVPQVIEQHNGTFGEAPSIENVAVGAAVNLGPSDGYAEDAPKDMVTALPEQVTTIRATFDKPGRYVWHCHILSHEDHEMMRVMHVGPGA